MTARPEADLARQPDVPGAARREQTRTRHADAEGYTERDGMRVFTEGHGTAEPTVLLFPDPGNRVRCPA